MDWKKIGYGILQGVGAFFDSSVVPAALRWSIFVGIGLLVFWQGNWDWWYLLKFIAGVVWVLFGIVMIFIISRRIWDSRQE